MQAEHGGGPEATRQQGRRGRETASCAHRCAHPVPAAFLRQRGLPVLEWAGCSCAGGPGLRAGQVRVRAFRPLAQPGLEGYSTLTGLQGRPQAVEASSAGCGLSRRFREMRARERAPGAQGNLPLPRPTPDAADTPPGRPGAAARGQGRAVPRGSQVLESGPVWTHRQLSRWQPTFARRRGQKPKEG